MTFSEMVTKTEQVRMGYKAELWVLLSVLAVVFIIVTAVRFRTNYMIVKSAVLAAFEGKPLDDKLVVLKGVEADDLCRPLKRETMARIHACEEPALAKAKIYLSNFLLMFCGIVDLEVRYEFEGDGVEVHTHAEVRVCYYPTMEDPMKLQIYGILPRGGYALL